MNKLTYKDSGVDVTAGYKAVDMMKKHISRTVIPGVLGGIGDFGGLFELPSGYKKPVLVSGTDGVGTKLQFAFIADKHNTIGIDCVAMCVNDIICQGAKPLFFLDYIGCGVLIPQVAADIVEGVSEGCVRAGCALIGGETAEMPGFYKKGEYDIAGFSVGIADKDKLLSKNNVSCGNVLIGLPSSGIHSNGYSLVRKLFLDVAKTDLNYVFSTLNKPLIDELLTPTRIYVKPMLEVFNSCKVNAVAHITGGGFIENIPRIIPSNLTARINKKSIPVLPIFDIIAKLGNVDTMDMFNTFNMGIGMVLAVDKKHADSVINKLTALGECPVVIGDVINRSNEEIIFE